jgi:hypothetical protein
MRLNGDALSKAMHLVHPNILAAAADGGAMNRDKERPQLIVDAQKRRSIMFGNHERRRLRDMCSITAGRNEPYSDENQCVQPGVGRTILLRQ